MQPDLTLIDYIPGTDVLTQVLQRNLQFYLNKKMVKSGKLILFKRVHYCMQITLQNTKNSTDNYEIPIPFNVEYYPESGLIYFDYRINTLSKRASDITKKLTEYRKHSVKTVSNFYDRILEITVE